MPERVLLTRQERTRILAGDHGALIRQEEPTFAVGAGCVLAWSHARRFADKDGTVFKPPALPLVALKVTSIVRRTRGGWSVRFDVSDRREVRRYLRRTTPTHDVIVQQVRRNGEWLDRWTVRWGHQSRTFDSRSEALEFAGAKRGDRVGPPTAGEIERARQESAYTTDASGAIDLLEVVDDETLKEMTEEARQVEAVRDHREVGDRVRAIEELPPVERVIALAQLAKERGVDCRDDIKALERRLQRRLGLAA